MPGERIVSTEVYEGMAGARAARGPAPVNTVTFTESDGRTTLTLLPHARPGSSATMIIDSGMEGGMQEQMELLEELARSLR